MTCIPLCKFFRSFIVILSAEHSNSDFFQSVFSGFSISFWYANYTRTAVPTPKSTYFNVDSDLGLRTKAPNNLGGTYFNFQIFLSIKASSSFSRISNTSSCESYLTGLRASDNILVNILVLGTICFFICVDSH